MKQKELIKDYSGAIQYSLERLEAIATHCRVNGNLANPHKIRVMAMEAIEEIKRQTEAA
jgi:hypothetical protein